MTQRGQRCVVIAEVFEQAVIDRIRRCAQRPQHEMLGHGHRIVDGVLVGGRFTGDEDERLLERQRSFDLARYDRMSVLTRELRSLVAEARSLELRFTPGRVLDRAALSRTLRWV